MDANDSPDRESGPRQPHDTSFFPYDSEDPQAPHYNWVQICLISAMGLAVGVMGTAAYVIWFSRDQQTYSDAVQAAKRPPPSAVAVIPDAESAVPARAALPTNAVTGRVIPATPTSQPRYAEAGQANEANRALASAQASDDAVDPADTADATDPADAAAADDSQPAARSAQAAVPSSAARADRGKQAAVANRHAPQRAKPKQTFVSRLTAMFRKVAYHRGRERNNHLDPYSHP
ncbi:hypothetical protein [Paraburkholderia diazotrophica]|uniref:Uncharacterized protein n=1 Tax=Paraburkholderia diazotrophica TaxID=667676 RepID=A0A1H6SPE4_9BURK|nr:hypothetical protein [Paraburkholderia diazotrophica]SEI69809.1 hypothetical protein SAMN05192539_1003321 [Paraburkholderia diazotrophica]